MKKFRNLNGEETTGNVNPNDAANDNYLQGINLMKKFCALKGANFREFTTNSDDFKPIRMAMMLALVPRNISQDYDIENEFSKAVVHVKRILRKKSHKYLAAMTDGELLKFLIKAATDIRRLNEADLVKKFFAMDPNSNEFREFTTNSDEFKLIGDKVLKNLRPKKKVNDYSITYAFWMLVVAVKKAFDNMSEEKQAEKINLDLLKYMMKTAKHIRDKETQEPIDECPPSLYADDIKDYPKFIMSLKANRDPAKERIWQFLNSECQKGINEFKMGKPVAPGLETSIRVNLNAIIKKKDFFKAEAFKDYKVEEKCMIPFEEGMKHLSQRKIQIINRFLLESIYPCIIARKPIYSICYGYEEATCLPETNAASQNPEIKILEEDTVKTQHLIFKKVLSLLEKTQPLNARIIRSRYYLDEDPGEHMKPKPYSELYKEFEDEVSSEGNLRKRVHDITQRLKREARKIVKKMKIEFPA